MYDAGHPCGERRDRDLARLKFTFSRAPDRRHTPAPRFAVCRSSTSRGAFEMSSTNRWIESGVLGVLLAVLVSPAAHAQGTPSPQPQAPSPQVPGPSSQPPLVGFQDGFFIQTPDGDN